MAYEIQTNDREPIIEKLNHREAIFISFYLLLLPLKFISLRQVTGSLLTLKME